MKNILFLFGVLLAPLVLAQTTPVYKSTATATANQLTGSIVAGDGKSITATGTGTIVATSLSGGVALTATYVGYGSGANALTGEAAFTYTAASNLLSVDNLTLLGLVKVPDGTAAAPPFTFTSDPDTGIFRVAANTLGLTSGATETARITSSDFWVRTDSMTFGSAADITFTRAAGGMTIAQTGANQNITLMPSGTGSVIVPVGSAANPSLAFSGDTNTGIYSANADQFHFTVGGVVKYQVDTSYFQSTAGGASIKFSAGTASVPAFIDGGDYDTGMYNAGANQLGFATGGVNALTLDSSQNATFAGKIAAGGTLTAAAGQVQAYSASQNATELAIVGGFNGANNTYIKFYAQDASPATVQYSSIRTFDRDRNAGAQAGTLIFATADNGSDVDVLTLSKNVASYPAAHLYSTWFTGGTATTTKPHFLIEPTGTTSTGWSTSGTGLGLNAAAGFAGNLADLQVNGATKFKVDGAGVATSAGNIFGASIYAGSENYIGINTRSLISSDSDGIVRLSMNDGATGSSIDIATAGTVKFRNFAHSADAAITAGDATFSGTVKVGASGEGQVSGRILRGANGVGSVLDMNAGNDKVVLTVSTTTTTGNMFTLNNNAALAQTSGTNAMVAITPTYNQTSGTAANTDLLINRTETAVGSGAQNLIDAQVGGVSKFGVSAAGLVTAGSHITLPDASVIFWTNRNALTAPSDGVVRFSNRAESANAAILASKVVSAKTQAASPYSVTILENGTVFTNEAATGIVTFSLPTAVAGYSYTFFVQDTDGIIIDAASGDTIRFGATETAADGDITSTTIGSSITLTAINATEWVATSVVGTWAD